jgi:hypothetical protein
MSTSATEREMICLGFYWALGDWQLHLTSEFESLRLMAVTTAGLGWIFTARHYYEVFCWDVAVEDSG